MSGEEKVFWVEKSGDSGFMCLDPRSSIESVENLTVSKVGGTNLWTIKTIPKPYTPLC